MRYRLPRQLFNLVQTVGWVVVGNACRVAIVVYVSEHFSDRIASGRPHELLGLLVFVMIFLLAISTDRLFAAFASKPLEEDEPEVEKEIETRELGKEQTPAHCEPARWLPFLVIPVCLLVFLLGARLTYLQTLNHQGLAAYTYDRLPFPAETDLPEQIGNWRRVKFEHTNRGKENLQAEDSFVWTFEHQGLTALISVDCPWDVWHNLNDCYTGLGWNTSIRHFYKGRDLMEPDSGFDGEEFSQIGMNKSGGETGVVIFSSMDAKAQQVLPQFSSGFVSVKSVHQQIAGNIATTLGFSGQEKAAIKGYRLPLSTVQLYCTPQMEVTPDQIRELRGLFVEARQRLKQSQRFQTNSNPKLRLASKSE